MLRLLVASCLLLVACGVEDVPAPWTDDDADFGPGGKADDPNAVRLDYLDYDVLFTNPECRDYVYDEPVPSADGETMLSGKPKNVYCSSEDVEASAARPESPQHRILEWVDALGAGDEIFLAYLSFSNRTVGDALCAAIGRGASVTFVLDARSSASNALEACGGTVLTRGHQGSIGYAHNKVILINPNGPGPADPAEGYMRLSFSSGNMSTGTVTHHENWHFIEVARDGYFAQAHVCLMQSQLDEEATAGKGQYKNFLNACRAGIEAPEEDDIKAFFIPARDDSKRATRYLIDTIDASASIDLGAHRFGHSDLVRALEARLAAEDGFELRMVADDDLYWLAPLVGEGSVVGNNSWNEAENVGHLEAAGSDRFEIRYFETNNGAHQLHHNKYLIYRDESGAPFGLLCGAANLTKSGFNDNLENIYFVRIPEVLAAFDTQFAHAWGALATPAGRMPSVLAPAR